jgi:hypothetical protein
LARSRAFIEGDVHFYDPLEGDRRATNHFGDRLRRRPVNRRKQISSPGTKIERRKRTCVRSRAICSEVKDMRHALSA